MKDVTVTGLISKIMNRYVITADDGTQYELSAIHPWEAVAPDFGSGVFAESLGRRMTAMGATDGHTIWKASLMPPEPVSDSTKPVSHSAKRPTKKRSPSRKQ
ncbi:MAG: hypothetical protein C4K49_00640 [Candidatus Thorarchaeota archaeon]|nr:MAG: hypothetical protein C4K49_00640 [Candidatus Thorarchaeota archaeon]